MSPPRRDRWMGGQVPVKEVMYVTPDRQPFSKMSDGMSTSSFRSRRSFNSSLRRAKMNLTGILRLKAKRTMQIKLEEEEPDEQGLKEHVLRQNIEAKQLKAQRKHLMILEAEAEYKKNSKANKTRYLPELDFSESPRKSLHSL